MRWSIIPVSAPLLVFADLLDLLDFATDYLAPLSLSVGGATCQCQHPCPLVSLAWAEQRVLRALQTDALLEPHRLG